MEIRKRVCVPPQNGGRACTELPGDTALNTEISKLKHAHTNTLVWINGFGNVRIGSC